MAKRATMKPVRAWALIHDSDNRPMICGDYDQSQLTIYYTRPKTDQTDEHVIPVEIRELPRRGKK